MHKGFTASIAALAFGLVLNVPMSCANAANLPSDLPKATQKALADLKLDPSVLKGLDDELNVPKAWLDEAAKEKDVIILGTWENKEFSDMTAAFKERYPSINLKYSRGGTTQRTMQVLVALGEGRVTADVMTGIADATFQFKEMKALADLRELPGFKNESPDYVAADGTWLAHKLSFRCMAYNTEKVKQDELPKTWDDLLTIPAWRNGNLAISNHADSWLLVLWDSKGDKWGANFVDKLFNDVKPQRRAEGMTATTSLTAGGEFHANIPAPEWVAQKLSTKGAPIDYHCPSPVPITVSQIVMMDKAPHKNAARIFINWLISREGQILQYADTFAVPVHKDLQNPTFLPFAKTILGKPHLVRDDSVLGSDQNKKMMETWDRYWSAQKAAGGSGGKGD
jgi:iron(III) transport system substrate-binding protein